MSLQPDFLAKKNVNRKCHCFGKPKICTICLKEPYQVASRAGTPGFRAPEVLLKHVLQTSGIEKNSYNVGNIFILLEILKENFQQLISGLAV